MITEAILDVFNSFIGWLVDLIPEFSLPSEFIDGMKDIGKWAFWLNEYIPLDTLLIIVPIVCGIWLLAGATSAVLQLL